MLTVNHGTVISSKNVDLGKTFTQIKYNLLCTCTKMDNTKQSQNKLCEKQNMELPLNAFSKLHELL